jgi:membrane protein
VNRLLALLRRSAQNVTLPLFDGLSLYDVAIFFWKGIYEGAVTSRAASISFSFFLALFPGVIFVFTLIPFIPVDGFQHELFRLLRDVLPPNSFDAAYSTITDILTIKRGDLLGITVAAALFFATNGTLALIGNFGQTVHRLNVRGFWSQYLAAFWLTLALALLLIGGIAVLALGEVWIPT